MKTNKVVILLIATAVIVGAYTVSSAQGVFGNPQDDPLNNDIRIISGMLRAGDYVHAIDFLDRSSSIHGQDPRLMELYKQAFKLGKMYPQLEELIRKLIAQNPRNPILLNDLGEARFLQNDESGADSIWRQALEIGRNDEMAYRYVADTQLRYGLYDSAVEIYLTGRRNLNRSSLFSPELASIYEAQRDYARAIDEYIVQLYEAPDRIGMVSIKIRGLVEDSEDSQEIVKTLNARINDAPGRTELYEILGDLYIKLNQVDKALECFKSIGSKLNDDGQSLIRFAGRAHESRAYGTAISAIDEYFKVSKKKTFADLALLTKARAQLAAGRSEEALGIYRNLASSAVDYRIKDEAGFTSGLIYARHRDDCDSAIAVWNAMLREARDPILSNRARLETAVCKIKESDYGSAGQFLAGVAASNIPDSSVERALFLMGEIGFYSGDFKKAEDIFRQMVRQFPNAAYSNDALMRIDVISLAGGDSANFPRLASFADAMKARMTGQPVRAAEILSDSAFEGSPMAEQALFFSGISFSAGNNSEHAISALQRYIEKYPDGLYTDRAYLEIGDIYGLTPNTYPESRNAYDKILELFPNGPVTEIARQRLRLLTAPDKVG